MARQSKEAAREGPVPVLLTRPEAQSQAFAIALTARFGTRVRPVLAPLMAVGMLTPTLPEGGFAGVIFTSVNGVAAAARFGARLPGLAWCVGDKTAEAARAAGFSARSAGGDADALVAAVLADPPAGRLVHLRGEETRGNVAERLISAGIETISVVVYRQVALPLPGPGLAALRQEGPVIVPLFSPQSAQRLAVELSFAPRAALRLVVMSEAVAEAATGIPRAGLWFAGRPDAEAMLQAVGKALETPGAP